MIIKEHTDEFHNWKTAEYVYMVIEVVYRLMVQYFFQFLFLTTSNAIFIKRAIRLYYITAILLLAIKWELLY